MKTSTALKTLLGAGALTLPLMVFAESNVQTGAATAAPGATAHVDFTIVIPKILYLRVGNGSSYSTGALTSVNTIDLITFSPAPGTVGNGTPVAGTGGDLTGRRRNRGHRQQQRQRHAECNGQRRAQRRQRRHHPVHPDHHRRHDADLRHATAGAGADQRHQLERRAHRTGDQAHRAGCQVDLQLRQRCERAGRYVRRRQCEQWPRGVHRDDAVIFMTPADRRARRDRLRRALIGAALLGCRLRFRLELYGHAQSGGAVDRLPASGGRQFHEHL